MKKSLLFIIFYSLLFVSCQKEKLPKLTHEGKNTFGCKVNGKNWVPSGGGGFSGIKPVDGGYQATYIFNTTRNNVFIRAYDEKSSVNLYLRSVEKSGTYLLNVNTLNIPDEKDPLNYGYYESYDEMGFITTSQYTGKVNIIRADTINKIVSGTFEFTGVSRNGKTVNITDGRFDVKKQ